MLEQRLRARRLRARDHTLAIEKYSTTTEQTFIPRLTRIAASVDTPSIREMKRGPISLQIKSIRLIWAFIAVLNGKLAWNV